MDNKKYTTKTAALRAVEANFDTLRIGEIGDVVKYIDQSTSDVADVLVDAFQSDTYWYRLYKSGWIEQGGTFKATVTGATTVTIPKMMRYATYYVHANYKNSSTNMYGQCYTLTTTSFMVKTYKDVEICWEIKGFCVS